MSWNKKGNWYWGKKNCPICNKEFDAKIGHPSKEKKTCSHSCANSYFRSGENHPNWKHGYSAAWRARDRSVMADHCEICESTKNLCYDHDHDTGKYRGTLCRLCNRAIGFMHNNPDKLKKAVEYLLERNNER